jgi:hypothetical protein
VGEFDLIPARHRRSWQRRLLIRRLLVAYAGIVLALIGGELALLGMIRGLEGELGELRRAEQVAREQRTLLEELQGRKATLDQELRALEALRGSVAVKQMFLAVDRAIDGNIRFSHWTLRRAGERVENEPKTVRTGYFLVVPAERSDAPDEAWLMQTNMEIRGLASDHSALAGFVQRLVRQPEIEEAHIRHTETRRNMSDGVVNFELAVVVKDQIA